LICQKLCQREENIWWEHFSFTNFVVVPKKSGEVRICVDIREAKKAIKREKHLMPTIDDLVADLNGATHFSTLDLSSGYHQLELAPESP